MGRKIGAAIFLLIGASLLLIFPNFYYLALYKNDSYVPVFIVIIFSILWLYLGNKIGKFKTTRPLGLAIFLPGILVAISSLVGIYGDKTLSKSMKQGDLEIYKFYSKFTLIIAIVLIVIGFLFFILKALIKPNTASSAQKEISVEKN
jgi:hypothetical protein